MLYLVSLLVLFYIYIISLFANLCIFVLYLCICIFVYFLCYIFVYICVQRQAGGAIVSGGLEPGLERRPVLPAPLFQTLLLLPPPWLALPASLPACLAGHPAGEIRYCAISLSLPYPSSVLGEQVCLCEPRNVFPCETM